jgi:hypothetical protein
MRGQAHRRFETDCFCKAWSDLCGPFWIGFADRGVGILRRLYGFLDGRRGRFGWGAEFESVERKTI